MLSEKDRQFVRDFFAKEMEGPVEMILFTASEAEMARAEAENPYLPQMQELMEELTELSPKLSLRLARTDTDPEVFTQYGVPLSAYPVLALLGEGGKDYGIRFYGIPAGYEFRTLMDDIVDVSRGRSRLKPETIRQLAELKTDLHFQVFVTPTCPYCPRVVRLAHQFALESPRVRADMIEATEFSELANRFNVYGVPKTVINDGIQEIEGAVPEDMFLEAALAAAAASS
ncbi:MAG: thioredoxin family protein [Limnochordales bacterium]|nr:thioredoxin family protein [Limnochordales bacterium]